MLRSIIVASWLLLATPVAAETIVFEKPVAGVLQPGQKPRAELRLAPAVGAIERVSLELQVTYERKDDQPGPGDVPRTELDLDFTVTAVTDTIALDFAIVDVRTADSPIAEIYKPLAGAKGKLVIAPNGAVQSLTIEAPEAAADGVEQVRAYLWALMPIFPKDAIGVGANWQTSEVARVPTRFRKSGIYRFEPGDATRIDVELSLQQLDKRAYPDIGVVLESTSDHGRGKATFVPGNVFADIAMTSKTKVDFSQGKARLTVNGTMATSLVHR